MFLNIKYAYSSLTKNIYISIVSIIQLSICFVFLYFAINQTIITLDEMNKITNVLDNKKIYSFRLLNEVDILDNKVKSKKIKEFYQLIKNNYDKNLAFYSDENIQLRNFKGMEQFMSPGGSQEDFSWVRSINIDSNFISNYSLKLDSGRMFQKNDFEINNNKNIPVILGNEYTEFFKIGDTIEYKNQYGSDIRKLIVIGFLSNNSIFISNYGSINLDSYVLFPIQPIENTISLNKSDIEYKDMLNFLEIRLLRQTILSIDEKSDIFNEINNIINEKDLSDMVYLEDMSKVQSDLIKIFKQSIYNQIMGLTLAIIFVTTGLIFNSLNKIKSKYTEFGVHVSFGCSIIDIFWRILFEFILLSMIAFTISIVFIITYSIFGNVEYIGIINLKSIVILNVFSIVLGCIIALPSSLKIKKISITDLIRR